MDRCPTLDDLNRLGHDSLDSHEFAAIEAHVDRCDACRATLEGLAGSEETEFRTGMGMGVGVGHVWHGPSSPIEVPGFEIQAELGRGGMGVVYAAWEPRLARRVAIKIVGGGPTIRSSQRARWLYEAQAIGRVRHPNVVRVYQADERDGWFYLVLEMVPGGSLRDRVSGPLPPKVAARLIEQVARAVDRVHEETLLHLDIKPSNILLDGSPESGWDEVTPLITDFGIARMAADVAAGGTRGTPSYMAPEQLDGPPGSIGPATDVYGLGATLYALLTGRPPFLGSSSSETMEMLRASDPANPRSLRPDLPRDIETIALTCLNKNPERRYASAAAMADDLRRWLGGFPIAARPAGRVERLWRWCGRHPSLAVMAGALATIVVASLVGLWGLYRKVESSRVRAEMALAKAVASDREALGALTELVSVVHESVLTPETLMTERTTRWTRVVHNLSARLRATPNLGRENLLAVARLERFLSDNLRLRTDYEAAGLLLDDAIGLLETNRSNAPGAVDVELDREYLETVLYRAVVAESLADLNHFSVPGLDVAWGLYRKVAEYLLAVDDPTRFVEECASLTDSLPGLALKYEWAGKADRSREIHAYLGSALGSLRARAPDDPRIALLHAINQARDHGVQGGEASRLAARGAIRRLAEGPAELKKQTAYTIGAWVGDEVLADPRTTLSPERPEEHARVILAAIDREAADLRLGPEVVRKVAFRVGDRAMRLAIDMRRAGRIDEARRMVGLLTALVEQVLERDPTFAQGRLLLSQAHDQRQKLAWTRAPDHDLIERERFNALREARRALELDPENDDIRRMVAGLQEKYILYRMDRP
jgi:hypothetical protein